MQAHAQLGVGDSDIGCAHVGFVEHGSVECGSVQAGAPEVGPAQVGRAQVATGQVGALQRGGFEVATGEAAAGKVRAGQVDLVEQPAAAVESVGLDEAQDRPPAARTMQEALVIPGGDLEADLVELASCSRRFKVSDI